MEIWLSTLTQALNNLTPSNTMQFKFKTYFQLSSPGWLVLDPFPVRANLENWYEDHVLCPSLFRTLSL